ncbi:MAG: TatD family hydrolase [Oligosphaeraceae bacterium]|nr:TatD family hydrolase [Oligosphaeraceae bacterium]
MHLFDTHLHLSPEDDAAAVLSAARAVGVGEFLLAGTALSDGLAVSALAGSEPGVYAAVGVHPHAAASFAAGDLPQFRTLLSRPGVVAVGEIGLDYHYDFSPREVQRQVLALFLELAAELHRPVVIHCREAFADCHALVQRHLPGGAPFVVHSFTGTPEECRLWQELGAYISVNGMVTFTKADNIRAFLPLVQPERLLLETDSPYLAPVPYRGRTNCPAYLPAVAQRVAQELGLELSALAELTTANARRFFALA